MTRGGRCQICHHPERARIEALRAGGSTLDSLAAKFSVHRDAVWRHVKLHVTDQTKALYLSGPGTIAQLKERAVEEGGSILDYLQILRGLLMKQVLHAAETKNPTLSALCGRLTEVLREIGKITGEIQGLNPGVNINVGGLSESKMLELNEGLMRIAREHPAARADILSLLQDVDRPRPNGHGGPLIEGEVSP